MPLSRHRPLHVTQQLPRLLLSVLAALVCACGDGVVSGDGGPHPDATDAADRATMLDAVDRAPMPDGSVDAVVDAVDAGDDGCVPSCANRVCGSDGCGGTCGTGCTGGEVCDDSGQCVA